MNTLCALALVMLPSQPAHAEAEPLVLKGHTAWIGGIAFSPDGKSLATASGDGTVKLWEAATGKEVATLKGHTDCVTCVAFRSDGEVLASGSFDGDVRLWDPGRKKLLRVLRGHRGAVQVAAFVPNDDRVFTGGMDGKVHVWNTRQPRQAKPSQILELGQQSWINGLALSEEAPFLISGSSDGTIVGWQISETPVSPTRPGGAGEVRSVAITRDGGLVAAGNRYGTVRIWRRGKEAITLKDLGGDVWSVAFTPDGKTLAAANGDWRKPGEVRLFDTTTWKQRGSLKHTGEVLCIAYSPDGKRLAAGSWDRTVRVWTIR